MAKGKLPTSKLPAARPDVPSPCSTKSSKQFDAQERRWKAQDALRDIQRVRDYEKDKSLMSDVKTLAQEQIDSLKRIK